MSNNNTPNINDMVKGWFIGSFEPTLLNTSEFEVGIKKYKSGDSEQRHVHKIATEYTVILNGSVKMDGKIYDDGDIVIVEPGKSTDFEALTDVTTVVVKTPSVKNDKYVL